MRKVNKIYDICQKSVRVCIAIHPIITMRFTDSKNLFLKKHRDTQGFKQRLKFQ